ncbi:MAG: geranylgeranyl reductase family protein, partial [Acidimicrobiia bacterium]|nr:geranylgeranyl reductase family protein [Acidimicrobiia bacterium]
MPNPEILVVGGGPGGAAASYHLAARGHDVLVVEKKEFPREKTCGDGLTPRSIYELTLMGFDFSVPEFYRVGGLRAYAGDRMIELEWPDHPTYPNWGGVMRRIDLDYEAIRLAEKQGAVLRTGTVARPIIEDGRLAAVELTSGGGSEIIHPKAVVVADGSLSRFGRGLGAARNFAMPYGLAARGYYASPRSDDRFIESHLSLNDAAGATVPGYGWIFPLGDGEVNVGVGVLSTFHRWKEVNTSTLMGSLEATASDSWGLSPETATSNPRGGKLPMAFSVGPKVGPNWVLVGDAAGAITPFNGEGIAYAYETGRIAANHVHAARAADDLTLLQGYRTELDDTYGLYYRTARAFVRAIGRPGVMRVLTRTGLRSRPLMEWVLRTMA